MNIFLQVNNVHILFIFSGVGIAFHPQTADCGCNARILQNINVQFGQTVTGEKEDQWTTRVLSSSLEVHWELQAICHLDCSLFIHRSWWRNGMVVWAEPPTVPLFKLWHQVPGEDPPPTGPAGVWRGSGRCSLVTCYMLHPISTLSLSILPDNMTLHYIHLLQCHFRLSLYLVSLHGTWGGCPLSISRRQATTCMWRAASTVLLLCPCKFFKSLCHLSHCDHWVLTKASKI